MGAAAASANTAAATSSAYSAGVAAGNAGATGAAYSAGYMAGSTAFAMGAIYATLPVGCATPVIQGTTYYLCGSTWFQPSYGANGVYYRVVPTP